MRQPVGFGERQGEHQGPPQAVPGLQAYGIAAQDDFLPAQAIDPRHEGGLSQLRVVPQQLRVGIGRDDDALARIREWDYVADGPIALGTFLVRERPVFGDRFLEYGDAPIDVEAGVAEVLRGLT